MPDSQPLKLFIIYSRDDQPALLELKAHLRPLEMRGDLTVWYDGEILPGQDWDKAIKEQLAAADIVLLFISKHFFNSEYIEKEELKKALERHKKGEAAVVPVILKPCLWDVQEEIAALQVLPKDGKPISNWVDIDTAWENVGRGIQILLKKIKDDQYEKMFPKCNRCHGKGKIWETSALATYMRQVKCPNCNGTGRIQVTS
jgi:hypothetical protein